MRKYSIITVENDEDEQYFMREGFDNSGLFNVLAQVTNGNELFEWLKNDPPHLPEIILSDLNMPGKNGYDILDEMRSNENFSHIPVIITSTSFAKSIIDKCFAKGAVDYMVKPDTFIEYVPFIKDLYKRIEDKQLVK